MVARAGEPMSGDEKSRNDRTAFIRDDIERTRANMSRTVDAIEERLSPAHIKEQVADIKQSVLGEYHEAKDHLKEDISRELREAKEKVQLELREAREKVRDEIRDTRMAVREATVGKVEHMVHDARETVTDAGTTVLDTIKANPVPAALVAVGLGWLLMSGRSSGSSRRLASGTRGMRYDGAGYQGYQDYPGPDYGSSRHEEQVGGPRRMIRRGQHMVEGALHDAGESVAGVGHRVQEGATHLADQASGVARDVGQRVSHLAHEAVDNVEHLASDARRTAGHLAEDVRFRSREMVRGAGRQARRAEQTFESTLRENPLAVGAVALAVGAAIALALPSTEVEDQWMGEAKDRLLRKAEGLAEGAIHQVENKAAQLGMGEGTNASNEDHDEKVPETHNGISNGISKSRDGSKMRSPSI